MKSIGEKILDQIGEDLLLMTTADDKYSITLNQNNIVRGYLPPKDVKSFPRAFYQLGDEVIEEAGSSGDIEDTELNAMIGIHFQVSSGKGNLETMAETIRRDLKAFINNYQSVKPNCLRLGKIPEVIGWFVTDTGNIPDETANKGLIVVVFKIRYRLHTNVN